MTTQRSCKRIWPNFLSQCGYTIAEILISWSVQPECPARELHQFNKCSVDSHLNHTSTTFTGRQDWELQQNKPSPNSSKNADTKSCLQQGGTALPRSQTQNFSGALHQETPLQHKGLTLSPLSHMKSSRRPGMHFSFCLAACVHYGLGLFSPKRWTDLAPSLVDQKKVL